MRGFGKIFLLLIIVIVGAPFGAGALALQQNATVPNYLKDFDYEAFNYETELESKMQSVIMSNVIGTKSISIDEEFVSKIIYKQMEGYQNTTTTVDEVDVDLSLNNMWVTFEDGYFTLFGLMSYNSKQTSFEVKLKFIDHDGYTEMRFDSLKIGKLPLPKSLLGQGLNYVENNNYIDTSGYTYGDVDLDNLIFTIEDQYIDEQLHEALGTDLVVFESLNFDNKNITLMYDFNESNAEAQALNTAINEIKNLVSNQDLRNQLFEGSEGQTPVLDKTDPVEAEAAEDMEAVLDILNAKVSNPTDENASDFTEEELTQVEDMATSYKQLPVEKQQAVVDAIVANMDEENKTQIEDYLSQQTGSETSLDDLVTQFLGGN